MTEYDDDDFEAFLTPHARGSSSRRDAQLVAAELREAAAELDEAGQRWAAQLLLRWADEREAQQ